MSVVVWVTSDDAVFFSNYLNREFGYKRPGICDLHPRKGNLVRQIDRHFFGSEYVAHDFALASRCVNRRLDWIEYAPYEKSIRDSRVVNSQM